MRTKDFSYKIKIISNNTINRPSMDLILFAFTTVLIVVIVGSYFILNFLRISNLDFRLLSIAAFSVILGRALDNFSTFKAGKQMDADFYEYGLDRYYYERNRFMSLRPTGREIMKHVVAEFFVYLIILFIYPPILIAVGTASILAWYNNCVVKEMIFAKSLGKKIKKMIEEGKNSVEITKYLDKILENLIYKKYKRPKKFFKA